MVRKRLRQIPAFFQAALAPDALSAVPSRPILLAYATCSALVLVSLLAIAGTFFVRPLEQAVSVTTLFASLAIGWIGLAGFTAISRRADMRPIAALLLIRRFAYGRLDLVIGITLGWITLWTLILSQLPGEYLKDASFVVPAIVGIPLIVTWAYMLIHAAGIMFVAAADIPVTPTVGMLDGGIISSANTPYVSTASDESLVTEPVRRMRIPFAGPSVAFFSALYGQYHDRARDIRWSLGPIVRAVARIIPQPAVIASPTRSSSSPACSPASFSASFSSVSYASPYRSSPFSSSAKAVRTRWPHSSINRR